MATLSVYRASYDQKASAEPVLTTEFKFERLRPFFALVLALGILVAGCGDPPPDQGYVRSKEFKPAHWEGGWDHYQDCGLHWSTDPQTGEYGYRYSCKDEQRWDDHDTWVTDRWRIKLEDCNSDDNGKRKCHRGWIWVDQQTYHQYALGSHYPDPA